MKQERTKHRLSPAAKICLAYLALGILWILFSDRLAYLLFPQPHVNEIVQTLKGWAFVAVTALFLYALCRRYIETIEKQLREMNHANHALRVLSRSNQALFRVRNESELLDSICQILVECGGYPLVWIGLMEPGSKTPITPAAIRGETTDQTPRIGIPLDRLTEPVASCLETSKPVITPGNPAHGDLSSLEGKPGSCIAVPLLQEDKAIGVLVIHRSQPNVLEKREEELLTELTGDLSYGLWALRSSSEREKALQELEETERHFRLLVEGATDHAIFMLDPSGKILTWNNGAQRVYGYTQEEIIGRDVSAFLVDDPEKARILTEAELEGARLHGAYQTEGWRLRKDGSRMWVDTVLSVLKNGDDQVTGYAKVTRDLTQLRLSEDRVRSLNEDLERRVAERTAEIMVANQGLEMFSYSVSHDLRAPLRAISGFAEILSRRHREGLNDEAQHFLSNIVEASGRMNHLIDDLLALARVGRQALRHEPVNAARILEELIRETAHSTKEYGVTVHSTVDLGPTGIYSDPALLRQILLNLLTNAITYRRPGAEGGSQVWACLRLEGEDLHIEVRDNGIGIPSEYREKIFKPFQRLHTHEAYPGTGIGLAIVKKAVDLLSARVWIDSSEGQGSTFFIQIPHCTKRSLA